VWSCISAAVDPGGQAYEARARNDVDLGMGRDELGLLCFVSLLVTEARADKVGLFFGWPPPVVGGPLAVALLGLNMALHLSRGPQLYQQGGTAKPRR
jgi:hypothetical protein